MPTFFLPIDPFDQKLVGDVFPGDWKNPPPAALYDLVVVGGGPAGMTAVTAATGLQARVAVVEKEHFGGECLSVGCIPSKALLRSARAATAKGFGPRRRGVHCRKRRGVAVSVAAGAGRRHDGAAPGEACHRGLGSDVATAGDFPL